jgi:glycosyltransferase involved in cell wall biosynthesis
VESGQKNIRVFHELIRDYFHQVASASNTVRKAEVDRVYRYDTKLYRPRLVERPPAGSDEICIDLVDVVIPARDEVETIANVITAIQRSPRVGRVIVVDNGSVDDTARVAVGAGAFVVQCPERGYGRAVKRGLRESERRWVLKLDADLENTDAAWPELLIDCAIRERSRLTKAYWTASTEDPDRVTNFTVKPAFRIFFQELLFLQSPLSGIYLFDRQAFNLSELPNGFSFDVALLISALRSGETISQAEIETVRHATIANGKRTYQHYYNMSHELLSFIVEAGIERLQ